MVFPNTIPDQFIRQHWSGGIGDPKVDLPNILDIIEDIYRAASEGPEKQKAAVLEYEDEYVLWVSGSGRGALLWTPEGCWGFDGGTTENLSPWATSGIFEVPEGKGKPAAHAVKAWADFLLPSCVTWQQNRGYAPAQEPKTQAS